MPYDRDYYTLPEVERGQRVRVTYTSKQNSEEQQREGEVIRTHVNGFTFDHEPSSEYATGIRCHEREGETEVDVSTVRRAVDADKYFHSSHLNPRGHGEDDVSIEVLE